jgi:hypothetical protein
MCKAPEERVEFAERESPPAVVTVGPAAAVVPAAPTADFVESAAESDVRAVAPAEQSDAHSVRVAEIC